MTDVLTPRDEGELASIIADAAAKTMPLAVVGGGTKSGLGRPMQTAATVSTSALSGVTLYEPTELVLSAKSGTPLAEIEALLAAQRQRLAFEPPDYRSLFAAAGAPTIGGLVATNLSGPRRISAGAARDSLIGVRAVTGRGEAVKSGGRVMKNVTGLDLARFLAGSYGTLAVLSEVSFKVLPTPEREATLVWTGLTDERAVAALSAALGSPFGATGAAHISGQGARTLVRIDGFAASVADRLGKLTRLLAAFGSAEAVEDAASAELWQGIRDVSALAALPDAPVWRVSVRPDEGPSVAAAVRAAFDARVLYDWGGGLVWIAGGTGADAGAGVVREAARRAGGHATLVRASDAIRLVTPVFEPPAAALVALTGKMKQTFDPAGILNPGRMYPGV